MADSPDLPSPCAISRCTKKRMMLALAGPSKSNNAVAATSSLAAASSCSAEMEVTRVKAGGCIGTGSRPPIAGASAGLTSLMPKSIFSRRSCSRDKGVAPAKCCTAWGRRLQSLGSRRRAAAEGASLPVLLSCDWRRARPRRRSPSRSALLRVTPASSMALAACCELDHWAHIRADGLAPGRGSSDMSVAARSLIASASSINAASDVGRRAPTPAQTATTLGSEPHSSSTCLNASWTGKDFVAPSGQSRRSSVQRCGSSTARTCSCANCVPAARGSPAGCGLTPRCSSKSQARSKPPKAARWRMLLPSSKPRASQAAWPKGGSWPQVWASKSFMASS
mmetsp:Transcript_106090/g.253261  ORF Transcript_106090/g.253261 Transcript_106090/m.253261 type:complete len:337 (-) Transcript_106090:50-1060(-)